MQFNYSIRLQSGGVIEAYFSIERDNQIIREEGFWCEACLVGKPAEQSPDHRYCKDCYVLLLRETKLLLGRHRPAWVPYAKPQNAKFDTKEVLPLLDIVGRQNTLII